MKLASWRPPLIRFFTHIVIQEISFLKLLNGYERSFLSFSGLIHPEYPFGPVACHRDWPIARGPEQQPPQLYGRDPNNQDVDLRNIRYLYEEVTDFHATL